MDKAHGTPIGARRWMAPRGQGYEHWPINWECLFPNRMIGNSVFKLRRCHMKKIGLFILLIVILTACSTSKKTMDIVRTQSIIQAIHAVQGTDKAPKVATLGLNEVDLWQFPILMLLVLFLVVPFVLVVFVFIRCLALWKHYIWRIGSRHCIGEPDTLWKKSEEPNLYQQILLEQQWLFSQLISQSQEEAEIHDLSEPSTDWWG
jgi:hypothetical protein